MRSVEEQSPPSGLPSTLPPIGIMALAGIGMLSVGLFFACVVLLHLFRPDVDPYTSGLSTYALGPYGYWINFAFIVLGLGGSTLSVGLFLSLRPEARSLAGLILLDFWGMTTILAGIFAIDPEGGPQTTAGAIHNLVGLNFLLIAIGAWLISRRCGRDPHWETISPVATALALVIIGAAVFLFVMMGPFQSLGFGGLAQRIYWLTVLAWLFLVSVQLFTTAVNQR